MRHVGLAGMFTAVSAVLGLLGCVSKSDGGEVGGETHWLEQCDGNTACGAGLDCLCGRCTQICDDNAACEQFSRDAQCIAAADVAFAADCQAPPARLCAKAVLNDGEGADTPAPADAGAQLTETTDEVTDDTTDSEPTTTDDDSPEIDCAALRAEHPERQYYLQSPTECAVSSLTCDEGQRGFNDECGCGCEPSGADACDEPGLEYICLGNCCSGIDWICDEGETGFESACGCGCVDPTPDFDEGALIAKGGEYFDSEGTCGGIERAGYAPYTQACDLVILEAVDPDGFCVRLQDGCVPLGFVVKKPDVACRPCAERACETPPCDEPNVDDAGSGSPDDSDAGSVGCAGLSEEQCTSNAACAGAYGTAYVSESECFSELREYIGCVDAAFSCPPSIMVAYDGSGQCYASGGCFPEDFERAAPDDPCSLANGTSCP